MRLVKIIFFISLVSLILSSCEGGFFKCVDGSGSIQEENRIIGFFDDLRIQENYVVYIKQDTFNEVRIRAQENLLPYIDTRKSGDKLTLTTRNSRCLRSDQPIEVFIVSTGLEQIRLSSSGSVDVENMNSGSLELRISGSGSMFLDKVQVQNLNASITGSGHIQLEGAGTKAELSTTGSGSIRASKFTVQDCLAEISGSGSIYIDVLNLLDVVISGSGSVHYSGNPPQVLSKITGSGSLVKI